MAPTTRASSASTKAKRASSSNSPVPKQEPRSQSPASSRRRRSSSAYASSQDSPIPKKRSPSPKQEPLSPSPQPQSPPPRSIKPDPDTTTTKMPATKSLIKTTPHAIRMSYHIARGEQGVLTFEPYKSALLPLWRFRTVPIAEKSSRDLWRAFKQFGNEGDFVGMDMARKFIQMGMTRAKRYANHAGGRKYKPGTREELPRSAGHEGKQEKEAASLVFRKVWERCREDEVYGELKGEFLREQKEWEKEQ